jgi:hypothetical protein
MAMEKKTLHISQIQPRTRDEWNNAKANNGETDNPLRIVVVPSTEKYAQHADFRGDELIELENGELREYVIYDGHHRFFQAVKEGRQWIRVVVIDGSKFWSEYKDAGIVRDDC